MKRIVSGLKIVICPDCQGCGKLSHYDKDRDRNKLVTHVCNLCQGTGRVNRRIVMEYFEFLIDVV
ncbi:MAG: hypothetical protein K0Q49_2391 [Haloplasmataceae bacterium]|jgi:DnaJ-class molecular chaperone|nr:hypothetical protein [Haloplasmataceae bacterium]